MGCVTDVVTDLDPKIFYSEVLDTVIFLSLYVVKKLPTLKK